MYDNDSRPKARSGSAYADDDYDITPFDDVSPPNRTSRRFAITRDDWDADESDNAGPQHSAPIASAASPSQSQPQRTRLSDHTESRNLAEIIDLHREGFTQIPHEVIRSTMIDQKEKLVLIAIMSHADANGQTFVGHTTLSRELSMKPRTVHNALKWLKAEGFLTFAPPANRRTYGITLDPRLRRMMRKKGVGEAADATDCYTLTDAVTHSAAQRAQRRLAA